MALRRRFLVATTLLVSLYAAAAAQSPQRFPPGAPDAVARHQFTLIAGVRELADGRVIVVDEGDQRLYLWHPATGAAVQLGSVGEGPGQYRRIGRPWPRGSDSTYIYDAALLRWLVLEGGRVVELKPLTAAQRTVLASSTPKGLDLRGGVVGARIELRDSLSVVYVPPSTSRTDTLGRLAPLPDRYMPKPPPPPGTKSRFNVQIIDMDDALLFPDGAVAIARNNPFSVQWCARRTCGPVFQLDVQKPLTAPEKSSYLASLKTVSLREVPDSPDQAVGWPTNRPGFTKPRLLRDGSALLALPDGALMIHRFLPNQSGAQYYDVVERSGRIRQRIVLPRSHRFVGFGRSAAYIVITDSSGLETLGRYVWPPLAQSRE